MSETKTNVYEGMFLFPQAAAGDLKAASDHVVELLNRAGAECEVKPMAAAPAAEAPAAAAPAPEPAASAPVSQVYETQDHGDVAPPPQTDPLGITGDQIDDLAATIAPVGSELQDDYQAPAEPEIDIAGFDVAPVGSDLSTAEKKPDPPPPLRCATSLGPCASWTSRTGCRWGAHLPPGRSGTGCPWSRRRHSPHSESASRLW